MKNSTRKRRSDKFPLTLHPTGQYCKKIRGYIYYFGSDRKQALESYLDQAVFLHGYNSTMQKLVIEPILQSQSSISMFYLDDFRELFL